MENKVLVELIVPTLEEKYDVFIPVNRKVGNVAILLSKTINELSLGYYEEDGHNALYSGDTGIKYPVDVLIRDTDIRNSSKLILM